MSDITELKTRLMTWDWQSPDVRALREDHDRLERLVADMRKAGDGLRDSSFAVIEELRAQITELERYKKAFEIPIGWRYRTITDKHTTGAPLPGEIYLLDVMVWGKPGAWKYSDGPTKPDVDWMYDAEPLYGAIRERH